MVLGYARNAGSMRMNDRLRRFMEALSLLAKQSDEPETQLTMQARINEYFAGVDAHQSRGRAGRARVLGRCRKVRRSNRLIAPRWAWLFPIFKNLSSTLLRKPERLNPVGYMQGGDPDHGRRAKHSGCVRRGMR